MFWGSESIRCSVRQGSAGTVTGRAVRVGGLRRGKQYCGREGKREGPDAEDVEKVFLRLVACCTLHFAGWRLERPMAKGMGNNNGLAGPGEECNNIFLATLAT